MTMRKERHVDALMSALLAARQNEKRWMEMSSELSADSEQMEQWRCTAGLRRREVERIEALLAEMAEHEGSPETDALKNAVAGNDTDALRKTE